MNDEKTNKIISSEELDDVLPKYEPIKLSGKNLAQNYVSAFNTGMNIYQCINYLQGNIDLTINAVNDVVKSWNTEVSESIDQSKAIVRETTTEQFNIEWEKKQPELIEQVNTLNARIDTLNARMDTFSNPNLLINPDFKINQRGASSYTSGYTVDRWKISSATLNATNKTLSNPNSADGTFLQSLENKPTGIFTVTLNVASVTGEVKLLWQDGNTLKTGVAISKGVNTYTFTASSLTWVGIQIASGASIQFSYMKLEQGAVATPFVAPNHADELVKCERFLLLTPSSIVGYRFDSYIYVYLEKLKYMRIDGTCSVIGINNDTSLLANGEGQNGVILGSGSSVSKDKQFIRIDVNNISTNFKNKVIGIDMNNTFILIDAEIY